VILRERRAPRAVLVFLGVKRPGFSGGSGVPRVPRSRPTGSFRPRRSCSWSRTLAATANPKHCAGGAGCARSRGTRRSRWPARSASSTVVAFSSSTLDAEDPYCRRATRPSIFSNIDRSFECSRACFEVTSGPFSASIALVALLQSAWLSVVWSVMFAARVGTYPIDGENSCRRTGRILAALIRSAPRGLDRP
jgi:hypothetical protein